ncbi:hypothetical protein ACFOHQ_21945 [Xanthomonas fragariae]
MYVFVERGIALDGGLDLVDRLLVGRIGLLERQILGLQLALAVPGVASVVAVFVSAP